MVSAGDDDFDEFTRNSFVSDSCLKQLSVHQPTVFVLDTCMICLIGMGIGHLTFYNATLCFVLVGDTIPGTEQRHSSWFRHTRLPRPRQIPAFQWSAFWLSSGAEATGLRLSTEQ